MNADAGTQKDRPTGREAERWTGRQAHKHTADEQKCKASKLAQQREHKQITERLTTEHASERANQQGGRQATRRTAAAWIRKCNMVYPTCPMARKAYGIVLISARSPPSC